MITIVLVLLTVTCALLTVVFLGTLRGIAELRLRLSGRTDASHTFIDAGTALPASLLQALPDPEAATLIAFVSDGCDACKELATLLPTVPVPVVAGILGHDGGDIRSHLGDDTVFVEAAITADVAREWSINGSPLIILQASGRVVGSAYGVSTRTADELQLWWQDAQQLLKERTK